MTLENFKPLVDLTSPSPIKAIFNEKFVEIDREHHLKEFVTQPQSDITQTPSRNRPSVRPPTFSVCRALIPLRNPIRIRQIASVTCFFSCIGACFICRSVLRTRGRILFSLTVRQRPMNIGRDSGTWRASLKNSTPSMSLWPFPFQNLTLRRGRHANSASSG